jgi:hypothetical protein
VLERHSGGTAIGYSAGNSNGPTLLETLLGAQTPAAIQLCLPSAREEAMMASQLQARWPGAEIFPVGERSGNCLACTALIGLLLALAEARPGQVSLLSRWWDTWAVLSWANAC